MIFLLNLLRNFMSSYVSTAMPRKITYWNIHKRISGTIITSANRHHEFYYPLERLAFPNLNNTWRQKLHFTSFFHISVTFFIYVAILVKFTAKNRHIY